MEIPILATALCIVGVIDKGISAAPANGWQRLTERICQHAPAGVGEIDRNACGYSVFDYAFGSKRFVLVRSRVPRAS